MDLKNFRLDIKGAVLSDDNFDIFLQTKSKLFLLGSQLLFEIEVALSFEVASRGIFLILFATGLFFDYFFHAWKIKEHLFENFAVL